MRKGVRHGLKRNVSGLLLRQGNPARKARLMISKR